MNERLKFVAAAQSARKTMTELCEDLGVSRKTGYKFIARYAMDGPSGIEDRSRGRARISIRRPPRSRRTSFE